MARLVHAAIAIASFGPLSVLSRPAEACGVSAGSAGVAVCNVEEMREKQRKKWRVGGGYTFSSTALKFTGDSFDGTETFEQTRHAALAVAEWRATRRFSIQVGAGGVLGGGFSHPDWFGESASAELRPGFVGLVGLSHVALQNDGAIPFVLTSAQLAALFASTTYEEATYRAFDLRLGAAVGWTLFRSLSPYFLARVFGGPATWQLEAGSLTGTDKYHYQLGAGLSWLIAGRVDLFVEGVPWGERGVSAGMGVAF